MSQTVLIKRLLDDLTRLRRRDPDAPKWEAWRTDTSLSLRKSFGGESGQLRVFERLAQALDASSPDSPKGGNEGVFLKGLDSIAVILRSALEEVGEDEGEVEKSEEGEKPKVMLPEIAVLCDPASPLRKALKDFLDPYKVLIIFLREHTNYRQVPLEHMLNWKRVGHAVAVLNDQPSGLVEAGYLIGRLGMKQVTVLHTHELPLPESFYHPHRMSGGDTWQKPLAEALQETGYTVPG